MHLGNLATTADAKAREQKLRSQSHELKKSPAASFPDQSAMGWELQKVLKSGELKIKRAKSFDEILENKVWMIFHDLNFDELSIGRNFNISLHSKNGAPIKKQIDVFAKDDQTVFVIECKACLSPSVRSLQKDIAEFSDNKKNIANSIRKHYGAGYNPKIIWCFFTENVIWSEPDMARAKEAKIHVIRDQEILYYADLANTLGAAARFQFHAEFLGGQKIPELTGRKCAAVRTKQGSIYMYSFFISAHDLLSISFVNHRDLRDPSGVPSYQRMVKPGRLKKISKFIDGGGFFPNSIIVNFRKPVRFEPAQTKDGNSVVPGLLIVPDQYKSCWIIDGQHRLYSCAFTKSGAENFLLPVTAFDGAPATLEAALFATINKEQVKVQPRLLDELDGEIKWNSEVRKEQLSAIASRVVDLLKVDVGSPLYKKIQSSSISAGDDRPLTLSEVKKAILNADILGCEKGRDKIFFPGAFTGTSNEQTLKNAIEGLNAYFSLFRNANPERWDAGREGYLCNNFGVPALLRLLKAVFAKHQEEPKFHQKTSSQKIRHIEDDVKPILYFVKSAEDSEFSERFKVTLGAGGIRQYFDRLCSLLGKPSP